MRVLIACSVLLAGCAGAAPRTATGLDAAALTSWDALRAAPSSSTVQRTLPRAPLRISHAPRALSARGPVVDVAFENAQLDDALRLLADVAGVGLALSEPLPQTVSIDLRGVRPLGAMQMIAWANGVELQRVDNTIVARAARPQ